ncbi:MAG: amidohydrolase [Marinifilaceae bacterium]
MIDDLKVSLVQADLVWGDVNANLEKFSQLLNDMKEDSDLIVLPEMFTTGFSMEGKEETARQEPVTLEWMKRMAAQKSASLIGSIVVEDQKQFYNRLFVVNPSGEYQYYDKRHLFRMGQEHRHFGQGTTPLIVQIGNWRVRPLICYDLRFPVWSRNRNDYDLLIYIANWPESRRDVWNTLLKARALENQAFVTGVNRVGRDGMGLQYSGDSVLWDARGKAIGRCDDFVEMVQTVNLSLAELNEFRKKFPVHFDADSFEILP